MRPRFPHRSRPCAQRGLTLIELSVAVALLAVISVMSYRGIDTLNRTSERAGADSRRWSSVAMFFERFGSDVTQPARRPLRSATGPEPAADNPQNPQNSQNPAAAGVLTPPMRWIMAAAGMPAASGASSLASWWGRALPPAAEGDDRNFDCPLEFTRKSATGRNDVRLGYRLRGDRVELLVWPVLDRAPGSAPEIHVLLEGVASLRFRHMDANGLWQETWPMAGGNDMLPRAVDVEIVFGDGLLLHRVFALPS